MDVRNLYADLPRSLPEEVFEEILRSDHLRIERIVSRGHTTPAGQWYDQARDEWVILLKGRARLSFEGDPGSLEMNPGDYVRIPARCRHRVEYTAPGEDTIWLAVHYDGLR